MTVVYNESQYLSLIYKSPSSVPDMQLLAAGVRALPSVTVIGKVSEGSSELHQSCSIDIDITQYGIMPQQVARLRCFYPDGLRRLQKTTVPDAGKHVAVHGVLTEIEGRASLCSACA
jgi:hypothetical protein